MLKKNMMMRMKKMKETQDTTAQYWLYESPERLSETENTAKNDF